MSVLIFILNKGGHFINTKIINSILIILILFCFISLVGAASAANDINMNDNVLNDASIDIDEDLDLSKTTSNDISNDVSDTSDSADISDVNIGESSKNNLAASQLSANIDVYGSSFTDIQNAIDNANYGDVIYLGNRTFTGSNQINLYKDGVTIRGGSQSNPNN